MVSKVKRKLIADALMEDHSFQTAKQALVEVVRSHSESITTISAPRQELRESYETTLKHFENCRGLNLFYPYLGSGMGNGALVELADGSVKYDFVSGIGVHFGHCHPKLIEAGIDAAVQDIAMQGNLQQNRDSLRLAELLIEHSGLDHCFLTSSGAMANENALKLILQKKAPASRILAFDRCFMGRTITLSQITDKPAFREGLPAHLFVDYLPFYDWRAPEKSTQTAVRALKKILKRYPGKHSCMCFEMIQGEAGSYPGSQEFFLALIQVLRDHSILVFVDEVQTFGRTDHLFAFQHFGLQPFVDVVTCGKLLHTCATLYKTELRPAPGLLSQTYTAATSSIRVATAIVESLVNEGYLGESGKNQQFRHHFVSRLEQIASRYPDCFEGPFGEGLMVAITPFKGEKARVTHYAKALFEAGVISFIAGSEPTRIRFLIPAGGTTLSALDEVATILEETLVRCQTD